MIDQLVILCDEFLCTEFSVGVDNVVDLLEFSKTYGAVKLQARCEREIKVNKIKI